MAPKLMFLPCEGSAGCRVLPEAALSAVRFLKDPDVDVPTLWPPVYEQASGCSRLCCGQHLPVGRALGGTELGTPGNPRRPPATGSLSM